MSAENRIRLVARHGLALFAILVAVSVQAAPWTCKRGSFTNEHRQYPHSTLNAAADAQPLVPAPAETTNRIRSLSYLSPTTGKWASLEDYFDRNCVTAFLILQDGQLVYERYLQGRKPEDKLYSASVSKTLTAMAVGVALDEGRLKLADTVASHLPDLAGSAFADDTVEDLLRMTSAAQLSESFSNTDGDNLITNVQVTRRTHIRQFLATKTVRGAAPGERFQYNGAVTAVLNELLSSVYPEGLSALFERKIWSLTRPEFDAHWVRNAAGQEGAQCCFHASLRDYGRIAAVLANAGRVGQTEVLSSAFVRDMASMNHNKALPPTSRRYGYQVWLPSYVPRGTGSVMEMAGVFGQFVVVEPASKVVIVHMGNAPSATAPYGDWPTLRHMILNELAQ